MQTVLVVFGFASLFTGLILSIFGNAAASLGPFVVGFLCFIFARLGESEYSEAAWARTKLSEVVKNTENVMHELRRMSLLGTEVNLKMLSMASSENFQVRALDRIKIMERFVDSLTRMGISYSEIDKALAFFDGKIEKDLLSGIWRVVDKAYREIRESGIKEDVVKVISEQRDFSNILDEAQGGPMEEKIALLESFVKKSGVFDEARKDQLLKEIRELKEEMQYYRENRKPKKPSIWEKWVF